MKLLMCNDCEGCYLPSSGVVMFTYTALDLQRISHPELLTHMNISFVIISFSRNVQSVRDTLWSNEMNIPDSLSYNGVASAVHIHSHSLALYPHSNCILYLYRRIAGLVDYYISLMHVHHQPITSEWFNYELWETLRSHLLWMAIALSGSVAGKRTTARHGKWRR